MAWAGAVIGLYNAYKGSKKVDAPAPLDATTAAAAQGQANSDAARQTAQINRPDQMTPFGNLTWSQGGNNFRSGEFDAATKAWQDAGGTGTAPDKSTFGYDPDAWASNITLNPSVQKAFDGELGAGEDFYKLLQQTNAGARETFSQPVPGQAPIDIGKVATQADARFGNFGGQVTDSSNAATQGRQMVMDALGGMQTGPVDLGGSLNYNNAPAMPTADAATRQRVEDALYQRSTARLDPRFAQARDRLTSGLANQGITQGSEAYGREQTNFGQTENDAYSSAQNDAITRGGDAMEQLFGMGMSARQQGVGEANSMWESEFQKNLAEKQMEQQAAQARVQAMLAANGQFDSSAQNWQQMQDAQLGQRDDSALKHIGAVTTEEQRQFGNSMSTRDQVLQATLGLNGMKPGYTTPMPNFGTGNVTSVESSPVLQALLAQYSGQQNNYNAEVGRRNAQLQGGLTTLASMYGTG